MNRSDRRKSKMTGRNGFKPFPNINTPTNHTLIMAHKTQERKAFLAQCYKQGMNKYQAFGKWIQKEGLVNAFSEKAS